MAVCCVVCSAGSSRVATTLTYVLGAGGSTAPVSVWGGGGGSAAVCYKSFAL